MPRVVLSVVAAAAAAAAETLITAGADPMGKAAFTSPLAAVELATTRGVHKKLFDEKVVTAFDASQLCVSESHWFVIERMGERRVLDWKDQLEEKARRIGFLLKVRRRRPLVGERGVAGGAEGLDCFPRRSRGRACDGAVRKDWIASLDALVGGLAMARRGGSPLVPSPPAESDGRACGARKGEEYHVEELRFADEAADDPTAGADGGGGAG